MENDVPRRHIFTHPSPVEHWRHLIEIIALIVAALWGFYVFIYQERIKPAAELPNLDYSIEVPHEQVGHDKELITTTITWKNLGGSEAQVEGYVINTYGLNFSSGSDRLTQVVPLVRASNPPNLTGGHYSRGLHWRAKLIDTLYSPWHPLGGLRYAYVLPGETESVASVTVLNRQAYEAISVQVVYCFRRADDKRASPISPPRTPDGAYDLEAFRKMVLSSFPGDLCATKVLTKAL